MMKLFDVYPLLDITPVSAEGSWLWDESGTRYLDLYGGHAVISIGHRHPHYVKRLQQQLDRIGFYSNSVHNPLQIELGEKLGQLSGYPDYQLFLCSSGAEANENALKLASFVTSRKKVMAFSHAFHGRTSGAVAVTDNPEIIAPYNAAHEVTFLPFNDIEALSTLSSEYAAVIVEGIQGVAGIHVAADQFLKELREACTRHGVMLILDEVQCGYGRSGKFFAHQFAGIRPDLITVAKGMGNGFPIGGLLIQPEIKPKHGMLGTTFGGNHLGCAAALAVLEVIEQESLIENAATMGKYLVEELNAIEGPTGIRGRGLMIGIDLPSEQAGVRTTLLQQHRILTGVSKPNVVRLLPSLGVNKEEADIFLDAFRKSIKNVAE